MISVAPTRYLIGQALRDLYATGQYSLETIKKISPDLLNVSLIAPVKTKDGHFLLAQIK